MLNDNELNRVASWLQIFDFQMNISQLSNDELMKELIEQDKVLDYQNKILQEQNEKFLKKILIQNQKILEKLEGKNDGN